MKLNYKRTIFVGFAFFLISAFWQAYDAIVPLILTNHFGLLQSVSGAVMSLDNILAVFMLPIFGAISDKVMTKFGKRTPFILIGTVVAVALFIGLALVDNMQLPAVVEGTDIPALYEEAVEYREAAYELLAEGYYTTKALIELAERYGVELPIVSAVYNFLWDGKDAAEEIKALFRRSLKQEF
jgi:low affinity Fe/Cu permease